MLYYEFQELINRALTLYFSCNNSWLDWKGLRCF